jgi:hypothetical protein
MRNPRFWFAFILSICLFTFSLLPASAQSTIATGSIQGTVTDQNGAVVPGAAVTITSKATGQASKLTSNGSGGFASGALIPGEYEVRIEAKGFQTQVINTPVQVGNISSASAKLTIGQSTQVIEVTGAAVTINTEQATVQGVLTTEQIENLPINGRNFLDLAQLEPGVQIQDGGNFDPTKNGFSSISFGGRFGRTARIEVDGIDISDETVGTTTQNLPASSIQEFQVSQSSLDMSTELTSSGAVNVVTRSGTNKLHGEAFGLFRDHSLAAKSAPTDLYFQRNNFGGNFGGPIIKDKLFFFVDAERLKQDASVPVINSSTFAGINGAFNSPFRDTDGIAKLDWKISDTTNMFYRFSYEQNNSIKGFIPNSFQPFDNVNNTPVHVIGLNFQTGSFTHEFRFGYTKFRNGITDGSQNAFDPTPGISLSIGPSASCTAAIDQFCSGPSILAPQQTFQQNTQMKYDGSKTIGTHILRYGFGYNRIQGGGFAKFFALAPVVNADPTSLVTCGTVVNGNPVTTDCISNIFPGGTANPLNYPVDTAILGNGQGFSSEKPAFGLPAGGLGPDNRIQFYVGDQWKILPNLTLNYGVRYVHDTGRTDSDLAPAPCSQLDPGAAAVLAGAGTPCNGNILDLFGQGLGDRVRDPAHNFGPTVGFAWDPFKKGNMVVRGGIGIYYENSIFNNNLFDRAGRLSQGLFNAAQPACANGTSAGLQFPDGTTPDVSAICGQPLGNVTNQVIALQQAFQAATLAAGPAGNGVFIGNILSAGGGVTGVNMFAPNYQTPRSLQMNIGFEKQLGKGIVWTADYLRNVGTHTLLAIDTNHVGDARFFNKTAATQAVNNTLTACGVGTVAAAVIDCPGLHPATPDSPGPHPVTLGDFANRGLDSGTNICGGVAQAVGGCVHNGVNIAPAFGGVNPELGVNQMLFSGGRSLYNAFQTSLRANVNHPFRGVKTANLQVSYALSRYDGDALDSDFVNTAVDNNNPNASLGPNGLDRTHQLSFGGTFDLPWYIRFGIVGHVYSPLPVALTLPGGGPQGNGGIFVSDVTGDGSGDGSGAYAGLGDLVPGTKLGAYGRSIKPKDLTAFINNFNATVAGSATPAGQVLINNGLFTLGQLQQIGAVIPTLDTPTSVQSLGWLKTVDLKLSYPRKIREGMSLEPSVSIYNAFNESNFDGPGLALNGILNSGAGSVNGSTSADHLNTRILPGSGVFDLGSPRVMEFGLKFTF